MSRTFSNQNEMITKTIFLHYQHYFKKFETKIEDEILKLKNFTSDMTDCRMVFKELLNIGQLQNTNWCDNQLIHLQNSDDVAVKDFVLGKNERFSTTIRINLGSILRQYF